MPTPCLIHVRVDRAPDALPRRRPWRATNAFRLLLIVITDRPVDTEFEERTVKEAVGNAIKVPDVRAEGLLSAIELHRPDVLHLVGAPGLLMRTNAGGSTTLTAHEARLHIRSLARAGVGPGLIVLNGCYNEPVAQALAAYVDHVVGTLGGDRVAFANVLYQRLGAGSVVRAAAEAAHLRSDCSTWIASSRPRAPSWNSLWSRSLIGAAGVLTGFVAAQALDRPPDSVERLQAAAAIHVELTVELARLRPLVPSPRVVLVETNLDDRMSSVLAESVGDGQPSVVAGWTRRRVDPWYLELVAEIAASKALQIYDARTVGGELGTLYRAVGVEGSIIALVRRKGASVMYLSANLLEVPETDQMFRARAEVQRSVSALLDILEAE